MLTVAPAAAAETADKPERSADPAPLDHELEKYPRCSQCNMDRRKFHRTRHLIHYDDGTAEGSCSIRCVAVSLMQNLRKDTQAVYAADFGSEMEPRPLVNVEKATYIIGGEFPTVMSKRPKTAFASVEAARAAQAAKGGELADYDQALVAAFADMVEGLKARRQRRAEREERRRQEATVSPTS
ncbi:MAG TPA: nitrous oxide reductase accessory protein NosL [Rhodocyclaceae bacterium]|nr:nitrous oxide reductase accessory protein NosL [Rhodocyclaceae bacterium]